MTFRAIANKGKKKNKKPKKPEIYYEFQKAKGLDGTKLEKYYQPKQPTHFNQIELIRLKQTTRRKKFEWHLLVPLMIGGLIGLAPLSMGIPALIGMAVNLFLYWGVVVLELLNFSSITQTTWYAPALGIVLFYMIENQSHIYWKTRDSIDRSKIVERSSLLETRLGSTTISYIKANIIFAFVLRWLFNHGLISFSGNVDSGWSWLVLSLDNMVLMLNLGDWLSIVGISLSPLTASDYWSKAAIGLCWLFNAFIGIASIALVLEVMDQKDGLHPYLKKLLAILRKLLLF